MLIWSYDLVFSRPYGLVFMFIGYTYNLSVALLAQDHLRVFSSSVSAKRRSFRQMCRGVCEWLKKSVCGCFPWVGIATTQEDWTAENSRRVEREWGIALRAESRRPSPPRSLGLRPWIDNPCMKADGTPDRSYTMAEVTGRWRPSMDEIQAEVKLINEKMAKRKGMHAGNASASSQLG